MLGLPDLGLQLSPQVLSAAAVVFAAFIGFGSRLVQEWIDRRRMRMKLRQALQAELETMEWIDDMELDRLREQIRDGEGIPHSYVPTQIYDDERANIGLLSYDERIALIRYYQAAHVAQEQLARIENDGGDSHVRDIFADRTLFEIKSRREAAITQVTKRISLSSRMRSRLRSPLSSSSS